MVKSVLIAVFVSILSIKAYSIEVVSQLNHSSCEEFRLTKELTVYKDPSLLIGALGQMYEDPQQGWQRLMEETPILTTLEGTVSLMKLGSPSAFKNFGVISQFYELVEPKLAAKKKIKRLNYSKSSVTGGALVIPIRICGPVYGDSLGFVLVADLEQALKDEFVTSGSLPPSVYPNPVPKLKRD